MKKKEQKTTRGLVKLKKKQFLNLFKRYSVCVLITILSVSSIQGKNLPDGIKLSMQQRNVAINKVLDEIEQKTGYSILVRNIDTNVKVNINVKESELEQILKTLFAGMDVKYEIEGKRISIYRPTSTKNVPATSQDKKITGVVLDPEGEPIIGANILVKGVGTNGTITDMDGKFILNVPDNATLVVSYLGFSTQEIALKGKNNISVTLKNDVKALDEIVVVGYGTQKKVNLTGAITAIKTSELENIPVSNLSNALAGRAPGVTVVNNSGFAGSSSSIRIRGSFGEPLYVINGVIRDKTAFDALDPNEVENINILKDAASASIYGSKAGNGVVLVTTKKGSIQKPMFQYKGSYTAARTTRPVQNYSATDELTFLNRVAAYQNSELENPDSNFKLPYGEDIFNYFKDKSYNLNDLIWQNPWNQEHNISVNGGNERIAYYMMVGYHGEEGSYKNTDYNRYNFRSDITAQISETFKVNFNLSGNERDYDRFFWPYDWNPESMTLSDFYRTTFNQSRLRPWYVDEKGNPSTERTDYPVSTGGSHFGELVLGNNYEKTRARNFEAILRFDLDLGKIIPGLTTSAIGQYNAADKNRKRFAAFNKSYVFQSGSVDNIFIPGVINPDKMNIHNLGNTYENIQENVWLDQAYQLNWLINYNRSFGAHTISGMMAYEIAQSTSKYLTGSAEDLLTSSVDQIFVTSSDAMRRYFNGGEGENARLSWVGRFNYNYADKYIAEFSFRQDGNSKFGPGYRWGFFPSVSVGWRISNESFMQSIGWLSNLKLRGSYGSTGDDSDTSSSDGVLAAFGWRNKFKSAGGFMFGDKYYQGISLGSTPNPFITWATLNVYDAGLDFGFLNNSLVGEIDYFHKKKTDILQQRVASLPDTYGRNKAAENYAEQKWDGFEVSLRYSGKMQKVNYSINANLGYVRDEWTKYDEADNLPVWKSRIGNPNGYITGYIAEGIIRTQEQIDALPEGFTQFGRSPKLGQILYKDIRGANETLGADGKVDSNDWDYLSRKSTPRINYGFGLNLEWKGISLDALFQGVGAYDRMIRTNNGGGVFQIGDRPYFGLWAGDVYTPENTDAKYPAPTGEWTEVYGAASSTFWMRNGTYLRLKNLNVAYTLPKEWYAKFGISKVQVFGNGTNLFCISGIKEHDPEQDKLDSYPIMRTLTVGLNVNF